MDVRVKSGNGGELARRQPTSFDPFQAMQQMVQNVFGLGALAPWFERSGFRPFGRGGEGMYIPAFDVKERSDAYVIEADVPGVKEGDLDIQLTGNRLTFSGKREEARREEGESYYSFERTSGSFSRTFMLPEDVNAEQISADLDKGVLSVVLPKREAARPRKISLKERIKQLKS
jgi:HSP20 family protein